MSLLVLEKYATLRETNIIIKKNNSNHIEVIEGLSLAEAKKGKNKRIVVNSLIIL
ncbi:MAG: hypothetical protein JKX98_05585 [Alcanivoracaceae bacterium]|nr:hypothetical protein [Alcanivoracaceae bacterium]